MKVTLESITKMVEVNEDVYVIRISAKEHSALVRAFGRAVHIARSSGQNLDERRFAAAYNALTNVGVEYDVPE